MKQPILNKLAPLFAAAILIMAAFILSPNSVSAEDTTTGTNADGTSVHEVCDGPYEPVCGIDGETYYNSCKAEFYAVPVKYDGECEDSAHEECDGPYEPVCGSNGVTYYNECKAHRDNAGIEYDGECGDLPHADDPVACTTEYDPVCGHNGETYSNPCEAEVHGVDIKFHGKCEDETHDQPVICTADYSPVCGHDGRTYANACNAEAAGVEIKYHGECEDHSFDCPDHYEPVCGHNGVTYHNSCKAERDGVDIKYHGHCDSAAGTEHECPEDYNPVCGHNGQSYYNECKAKRDGVDIKHHGKCGEFNGQPEPTHFEHTFSEEDLKQKRLEVKRVERELQKFHRMAERFSDKGLDVGDLKKFINKAEDKLEEAYRALETDNPDDIWIILEEVREIMHYDLQDRLHNMEQGFHMEHFFHDTERMLKDMGREIERLEKRGLDAPKIYSKLKGLFEKARELFEDGHFEKAQFALEDLHNMAHDFWESLQDIHEEDYKGEFIDRGREMIEDIERGLEDAEDFVRELASQGKDVSRLKQLLEKAFRLKGELIDAVKKQDHDRVEQLIEKMEFGLKDAFEREVEHLTDGRGFEEAWEDQYKPDDFVEHFEIEDKKAEEIIERIANRMSDKIMAKLLSKGLPSTVVEQLAASGFEDEVEQTFAAVSYLDEGVTEILDNKAAILQKVKSIDEQIAELQRVKKIELGKLNKLREVKDKIANYNFASTSGTDIQAKIDRFLEKAEESGASQDEIEREIDRLQNEAENAITSARTEKFDKGIIPFLDSDDNDWFTVYAADAKKSGFVKGTGTSGGKELNPGGETNLAEAVTLFGRVVGGEEGGTPGSDVGRRLPEWARPGALALEKAGVDLDEIFGGKRAANSVSRAEIARLVQEVFELPTGDTGHFSDIGDADSEERDAIGAVNRADIMTGEGGTDRFNVDGAFNRAALVKVLIKAQEQSQ